MAANVQKAGFKLVVPTAQQAASIISIRRDLGDSPRALASQADVDLLIVPEPPDVRRGRSGRTAHRRHQARRRLFRLSPTRRAW